MVKIPDLKDLQKLYENAGGTGDVTGNSEPGSPKQKKAKVKPPPKLKAETLVEDEYAYCDIHFWTRSTATWNQVLEDGKTEVSVRGKGVLVFCHNHPRNESCTHLCRQVKGE